MTGIYNVVDKLRSGEALTAKEREVHTLAACGMLKDIHDELDAAVAHAYGWPNDPTNEEILTRLIALHDARVREEKQGIVRWLRPDYQITRFGTDLPAASGHLEIASAAAAVINEEPVPWPDSAPQQLAALQSVIAEGAMTLSLLRALFPAAKRGELVQHLEALTVLGLIRESDEGRYVAAKVQAASGA